MDDQLFPGFDVRRVKTGGAEIHAVVGGRGPPVLLLHGWPQTHAIWHRIAPRLAQNFTVVCADLRGYGDSSKPEGGPRHINYSKRAMAQDQVELMRALGFERFDLAGHDRGGRVAHRLVLDHPDSVRRLAVLDICPTRIMFERTDQAFATAYYHWFFLIQPNGLPEQMIGANPGAYLSRVLGSLGSSGDFYDPRARAEYLRCYDAAMIHATCEDYRAAADIDLEHDRADLATRRIECPLLVLWGQNGVVQRLFKPLDDWRQVAIDVRGHALPSGHFVPEEAPEPTLAALESFFRD